VSSIILFGAYAILTKLVMFQFVIQVTTCTTYLHNESTLLIS